MTQLMATTIGQNPQYDVTTKLTSALNERSHIPEKARSYIINVLLKGILNELEEVELITRALSHTVIKCITSNGRYYMKIRGEHLAFNPRFTVSPEELASEVKAIQLFRNNGNESSFAEVVEFSKEAGVALLRDCVLTGTYLDVLINERGISQELASSLGSKLGFIHCSVKNVSSCVRLTDEEDREMRMGNLQYRIGGIKSPYKNGLITELLQQPLQPILGDLSPHNIGIEREEFIFLDLDMAHRGNVIFDAGFLAAHLFMHMKGDDKIVDRFLSGYCSAFGDIEKALFEAVVAAIILYRLDKVETTYKVMQVDIEEKALLVRNAEQVLERIGLLRRWSG